MLGLDASGISPRNAVCRFKCFCQGVVYGLNLKAAALRSRDALRSALHSSLDDDRYSAGTDAKMQVILINDTGQVSEFAPGASDSKWPILASRTRRVYVSLV